MSLMWPGLPYHFFSLFLHERGQNFFPPFFLSPADVVKKFLKAGGGNRIFSHSRTHPSFLCARSEEKGREGKYIRIKKGEEYTSQVARMRAKAAGGRIRTVYSLFYAFLFLVPAKKGIKCSDPATVVNPKSDKT